MRPDWSTAEWLHRPAVFDVSASAVRMTTEPCTDLWQRTYYGFRRDNAPALLLRSAGDFSFTARASFSYRARFDQCGVMVYVDPDHWCKASVEHEDESCSRLGSVVTNGGYSDWATTDVATATRMRYRLSRRGPDFLIEWAPDEGPFRQMRIFHLHAPGDGAGLPAPPAVRYGVYACSPMNSSFEASFDQFTLEPSLWQAFAP